MRLDQARIGYAGYSSDWTVPGDRRRFAAYARQRGLTVERAELDRPYDLVVVTHGADLTGWIARKRREGDRLKLVFELIDSYLTATSPLARVMKGGVRFALGVESRPSLDFTATLRDACAVADAVICSTPEQAETIRASNPNVHLSFDWFGDDLGPPKQEWIKRDRLRLVWEGQAVTLHNLMAAREPINDLRDKLELTVVTDPIYSRWLGRFGRRPSAPLIDGLEIPKTFIPWRRETFSDVLTDGDLALIPIDTTDPMMRGKPENKLVLLWKLGLPVLVSDTPAYERTMDAAGLDMVCRTAADWGAHLERMIASDPAERRAIASQGHRYAMAAYSQTAFRTRFDAAFASVGLQTS